MTEPLPGFSWIREAANPAGKGQTRPGSVGNIGSGQDLLFQEFNSRFSCSSRGVWADSPRERIRSDPRDRREPQKFPRIGISRRIPLAEKFRLLIHGIPGFAKIPTLSAGKKMGMTEKNWENKNQEKGTTGIRIRIRFSLFPAVSKTTNPWNPKKNPQAEAGWQIPPGFSSRMGKKFPENRELIQDFNHKSQDRLDFYGIPTGEVKREKNS